MEAAISDMSPEEARKLIDEEIMKLHARCFHTPLKTRKKTYERASNISTDEASKLEFLKTRRNRYAPISKLPNETLVEIFTLADHSIEIGQTCQHWRFLAVGTPALWTHPPTHLQNHTLRFLERSKNAPLNIFINKRTPFTTTSAVLKHIQRIRTLYMEHDPGYLEDSQKVLLSLGQQAVHLESLSIEKWNDRLYNTSTLSLAAFGPMEQLRDLELSNVCLDWCILPFPNLTRLALREVTVTHDVTGQEFTSALRGMPSLEYISISFGDIELCDYSSTTNFEPIHLPWLTELDIGPRSHREHIDCFLLHTTLPRLRQMAIDYGNDPVDHSPMVRNLSSTIANGDFCTLEVLAITSELLRICQLPTSHADDGPPPYIEIFLPVAHEDFDTNDFAMATHIRSCITSPGSKELSSLVKLSMGSLSLTSDQLQQLFGDLSHLEHIEFSWKLADSFVEALSIPLNHLPDSSISFARLDSIEWYGCEFPESPYPDPELFDAFIDCLMQRCEYGAPIHNVALRRCHLAADHVESKLLKETVVNVSVPSSWS